MSSHHIVREKQEPALLVLGLDTFSEELLGQLLEWSPTLIATPDTAENINSQGIKVDVVIADEADQNFQSDVKLIPLNDDTPVAAALNYLITAGYSAVNIVTDNFELDTYTPFAASINLVIFCRDKKIFPVTSGFSKWKPAAENISILSVGNDLIVTGLSKADENMYTTDADGFFTLQFALQHMFIAEDL